MNVAARLCEYCKAVNRRLVMSGDLLHQVTIPGDLRVGGGESIALRGRQGGSTRSSYPLSSPAARRLPGRPLLIGRNPTAARGAKLDCLDRARRPHGKWQIPPPAVAWSRRQ